MVETVIVHIGMHKTGSTSIQNALSGYDDGTTFYPDLGHLNHSIPLYTGYSSEYRAYHVWARAGKTTDEIDRLRSEARETVRQCVGREDRRRMILSGEDIGLIDEMGLRDLLSDLMGEDRRVVVVCYVRDPLSFAASTFQQALKGGLGKIPPPISPRYRSRLETFLRLLGQDNVIVLPYDGANAEAQSVVEHFFDLFSLNVPEQDIRLNRSLSLQAAKLLYLLNSKSPLLKGDDLLVEAQKHTVAFVSSRFGDGDPIDPQIFLELADYRDAEFLSSKFNIHYGVPDGSWGDGSETSLSEVLADIDSETEDRLRRLMSDLGVPSHFKMLEECMVRIHYHFIGAAYSRRNKARHETRRDLLDSSGGMDRRKSAKPTADPSMVHGDARSDGGVPVFSRVAAWARKVKGE